MVLVDSRPPQLDAMFRPGNSFTLTLTWPAALTGRSFTATLDAASLDVTVNGATMTVTATEAQTTAAVTTGAAFTLTETTGGIDQDLIVGTWWPSELGTTSQSATVSVTESAATVTVTVTGASPETFLTLGELADRRVQLARTEGVSVAPGTTRTLATLTGTGIVTSIWLALGTSTAGRDMILRCHVDGETDPAVEVDAGTLLGSHYATTGDWFCDHVHGNANSTAMGGLVTFPMPYSNGMVVTLENIGSTAITSFAQVNHTDASPPPWRLRSLGARRVAPTTVTSGATFTFADLTGSGWLAYHAIVGDGVANSTWLERDIELTVDGEATPSWASTGLEDWFAGAWFWYGRSLISSPFAYVAFADTTTTHRAVTAVDLVKWHQGIRFDTSVQMVMGTEGAVTTDHDMAWCLLYYLSTTSTPPAYSRPATVLDLPGTVGAYASTPDIAALGTGDVDVRLEITPDDSTPAADQVLISKWALAGQRSWQLFVDTLGVLRWRWTADGTTTVSTPTASPMPSGRHALRVTHDVDNGAGGRTTIIYTGPDIDGPWTELGSLTQAGVTSVFDSNAPVEVGAITGGGVPFAGLVHKVEIRAVIDGPVVASADFTGLMVGQTGFVDVAGLTWTVNGTGAVVAA